MTVVPRLVLSAPSSGHGKNALAIGLLAALAERGVDVAGFKLGPDHVDAAYLGLASGRPGRVIDPRLVGLDRLAPLVAHGAAGAGLAVVQGSMGLYDAVGGRPEQESTAAAAAALRSPVVLVVDVAAMGQSVAALVHGFRSYDEQLWLGGVILNRVASSRHEAMLREALDDVGVPVYGALRRQDLPAVLPSRRHGVAPVVDGSADAARAVRRLGEAVAATVDLERLLGLGPLRPAAARAGLVSRGGPRRVHRPGGPPAGGGGRRAGRQLQPPGDRRVAPRRRRRGRHRRPAARRGAAGRHPRAGRRRRAARGVRRAVVGQPAALHRGGRVGADRAAGGRRGRRAALAGPGAGRAADVRCPGRDRRQPGRAGGRLPGGDRPDRQRGRRPRARCWSATRRTVRCSPPALVSARRGAGRAARRRASSGATCTPRSSQCTGPVIRRRRPGWSPPRRPTRRTRRCRRSPAGCPRDRSGGGARASRR